MTCPSCGRTRTRVRETRNTDMPDAIGRRTYPHTDAIWRKRICKCGHKFITIETKHSQTAQM